jgi:aldehyde:ferredoxin oxidoreductase
MGKARSPFSKQWGKQLWVDLAKGKFSEEDIGEETIRNYIGGVGLAAKILFAETGPQTDPLSSDNILIVSAGLLNGTGAPTACRTEVTTKSPLTGIIGSGNTGGSFGSMLRKAGYETIVITGRAKSPSYLVIDDGKIELKSASQLWGTDKDSWETTDAVKKETGKNFSVMAIGQAGENLVRFACPVVDYYHAPARSHAGCVMGSKNLKAIAVRGTKAIPIFWPERFKKVSDEIAERIKDYPARGLQSKIGTLGKQAKGRVWRQTFSNGNCSGFK